MLQDTAITYRQVLRERPFALLFTAQLFSQIGNGMTTVALGLLAYELAGRNAAAVLGTALTLRIIAYVVFAPVAGALADRIHRKTLLLGMDLVRFGIIALMPWVHAVWQVYTLIFLLNLASAFHSPVYQSVLPDILKKSDAYLRGLSLSRLAYDMQNLASPALAALLVAWLGFRTVFFVDAASFILSFLLVLFVAIPGPVRGASEKPWRSLPRDALHGAKVLLGRPSTRFLLFLNLAVALAGAAAIVDSIVYVKEVLHLPDSLLGIVLAAVGAGSLTAAYFLPRLTQRFGQRPVMLAGGLLLMLALLPGMARPAWFAFILLWFVNGAGQALIEVSGGSLLKEVSQQTDRARIYAAYFSLSHAAWLIGYPLAGGLATWLGPDRAFTLLGIAVGSIVLLAALAWPHSDRPSADSPAPSPGN